MASKLFLLFLTVLIAATGNAFGQICEHSDLSRKYIYNISTVQTKDGERSEISEIHLQIISKADKNQVRVIVVKAGRLFSGAFTDCSAARSLITGKNEDLEVEDNDFGDFIVADFNFDNREDFAVKQDSGGNGGAVYEYFTQNNSGKFEKDSFLTEKMVYFPSTFDARRKRLITYVHADAAGFNENVFKYNPAARKWTAFKPIYRKAGQ
ncbi:MAG TPA: hypothetical protein VGC97_25100 [Pyrinomonadaceae bacterium]|jgi:hypothetical protein